ncbi:hypothetical protein EYF80_016681 [Liparis tanakae]|uniref:Uncharacterized protein n=1 Tax=Liparis tanakae TaxID=230148 RepID=A0A4Z2I6W2_9TELE|nr:hypothetical protein EYF80_016681 [Liparis tanakae]
MPLHAAACAGSAGADPPRPGPDRRGQRRGSFAASGSLGPDPMLQSLFGPSDFNTDPILPSSSSSSSSSSVLSDRSRRRHSSAHESGH